MKLAVKTGIEI